MAILTLLPVAPEVTVSTEGCFEIYGFGKVDPNGCVNLCSNLIVFTDVLIDENLKPFLLGKHLFIVVV
jgi:hypothetical protein